MYCVSVVYESSATAKFDFDYYRDRHLPMVQRFLGSNWVKGEIRRGIAALDGSPPPYLCLVCIWINSIEALQATLAEHGATIMGDIPNYTNLQPIIQVDEIVN